MTRSLIVLVCLAIAVAVYEGTRPGDTGKRLESYCTSGQAWACEKEMP